jgi:small-conductance mechanosensitive channel
MAQPAAPSPAQRSGSVAISPADAQRTIDILQDDARRAELVRTLKTIAGAEPRDSAPAPQGSAPPEGATGTAGATSAAPAAETAAPTETAAPDTIVPLEAGGLIARTLRGLDAWGTNFVAQFTEFRQAAMKIPALLAQSRTLTTPAGKRLVSLLGLWLVATFAAGLALEWGLHHVLRRPRRALQDHANRQALHHAPPDPAQDVARDAARDVARDAERDTAQDVARAGLQPAMEGVAVVQSNRDGIERVETVPIPQDDAAAPPATGTAAARMGHTGQRPPKAQRHHNSHRHWRALHNLPYAIGALVLEILPVALFFIAATLTLRILAAEHPRVAEAIDGFVGAYAGLRVTMAVVRLLAAPAGRGLRLIDLSPALARRIVTWIRRIIGLALFGMAIADALPLLDTDGHLRVAFLKAVSLAVHLGAVTFVLTLRRPVRDALRAAPDAAGPLSVARNWLADTWAVIASVLIMAVWFVWAMGVEDGFSKIIHFVLVTAAVLVAARLLTVLILGALGRLFSSAKDGGASGHGAGAQARQGERSLSDRYYPLLRGLVSTVMVACTVVALCQAWGLDALSWFAPGTLGSSLASAALTIVIAVLAAIMIWESAHYAVQRRLDRWTQLGDNVRAARLRTLLPMLRTALFILIALIVGLTALNELGVNTTPLLAGASIVGVAVGFGSQKLVQDFITGIFLLMENAMRVGDWVTVAGVSGSVEYLSIRTVRVRGGDGALHIVPFSSVSTVSNSNRGIGNAAVRISVAYDADIQKVMQELKDIGQSLREDGNFKEQILNDLEIWGVDSVDGSMVTVLGQMRCTDKGRWGVQREINRRILERFRELGIEIANPRASLLLPMDASPAPEHGSAGGK